MSPSPINLHRSRCLGFAVGLLGGAIAGWVVCWYSRVANPAMSGSFIGAAIGALGGSFLGYRSVVNHEGQGSPDIASLVLIYCGALPGALVFLGSLGFVRGKVAGFLAVGIACAFPMAG